MLWLEKLPHELIAKISLQMDPWALMSLLKATPALCQLFIVIAGPARPPKGSQSISRPVFFEVKGLPWVNRDQFDPDTTRALIKIYEVGVIEAVNSPPPVFPQMSPMDSYVICLHDFTHKDYEMWRYMEKMFVEQRLTFWRNHILMRFDIQRVPQSRIAITETLDHLEIVDVVKIQGIDLGNLYELKLVFSEPRDGSRPEFSNVMALGLGKLSVFYYNSPPLIHDIHFSEGFNLGLSKVSMYHIPSLRYDLTRALPVYPSRVEDLDFSAICCGKGLREVRIIGGHDNILNQVNFTGTAYLYWRQTCRQMSPITKFPAAPQLGYLTFESLLPDASTPPITQINRLHTLHITAYDGLILRPLLVHPNGLHKLHVDCRGERKNRAAPSLVGCETLIQRIWSREDTLMLHGFSRPPRGQNAAIDEMVDSLINHQFTNVQNVIEERALVP